MTDIFYFKYLKYNGLFKQKLITIVWGLQHM